MKLTLKALAGGISQLLLFPVALFLAAGTLAWPAGWCFLILLYSFFSATALLLSRHNPTLLEERMSVFKSDLRGWDRWLFSVTIALCTAWLILIPLDAVRFHWTQMPPWLQIVGVPLLVGSYILMYLAFRENSYLTPMVRIQRERGHTVISTGPYRYVRHPMYTGFLLFFVGGPLLLGSVLGLVLSPILVGLIARRAVLEEGTLREELPGYDIYMTRVNYRFIPHIW